jgi:restriction system protein
MEQWQGEHFIIIDRGVALVSRATARTSPSALTLTDRAKEVESLLARFEAQWAKATPITLLYRDRDASAEGEQKRRLLVVSHEVWDDLIQELARHPQLMRAMTPRKFEELVAELLSRKGLKVSLTPHTRDGGRDILASLDSAMGDHLYLVECKRYAPDRLVGVELVRHLYGVVEIERATAGVLVTTSSFTSGARDLERTINHRLSLRDYDDLVIWLKSVVAV